MVIFSMLQRRSFHKIILLSLIFPGLLSTSSNAMSDNTIELVYPPTGGPPNNSKVEHAIIWLHGLGATSSDFPPIVPELGLESKRPIRFIFPQAPNRAITINGGMVMPGWYDIKGVDIGDKQDAIGMAESKATLDKLIDDQIKLGIKSENIIIAGFSQGGAVVYHTGLRSPHKLAGMLTLSTYLPFAENVKAERSETNLNIPIFASHGTIDPVVPIAMGRTSVEALSALGYEIKWQSYPMEHQVSLEQIQDIGNWINAIFNKEPGS